MRKLSLLFVLVLCSLFAWPNVANAAATVTPTLSPDKTVLAVGTDKGKLTISGSVQGEPEYDHDEFQISKTEWKFSVSTKEGSCSITDTKNQRGVWQSASSVECEISSYSAQEFELTGTASVDFILKRKPGKTATIPDLPPVSASRKITVTFVGGHNHNQSISETNTKFTINHNNTTTTRDVDISYAIFGSQSQFIIQASAHPGGLAFFQHNSSSTYPSYSTPTQSGQEDCPIPVTPTCKKMCKGFLEYSGKYEDAPEIHLPNWIEATSAGPQTKAAWQIVYNNILVHEQAHKTVYHNHLRDHTWWTTWAENKKGIEVCVDDSKKAGEIASQYLSELKTQALDQYNTMVQKFNDDSTKVDDDEIAAGTPMYRPIMQNSAVLLKN